MPPGFLASILAAGLLLAGSEVFAQDCNVPGSHPGFQSAVADPACTRINLAAGSFAGGVSINRSLEIFGAGSGATALAGASGTPTLTIASPAVVHLQGLTLLTPSGSQIALSKLNGASLSLSDVDVGVLPPDLIFKDRFERTFKDCADCPTMVRIPAGSFVQGSPASEPESFGSERPQRTVNVPAFAMGQTEVTFAAWDACVADDGCTHNPSDNGWGRGNRPVINVSWSDAQEYVTWLSNKTGHNYRLPSESEWEYATRAGTTGRFNTGDCITTEQANFRGTFPATGCPTGIYRQQTLPVASFAPNAFGLYDTHGNVFEWVQDCLNPSYNEAPTDGSAWMSGDCSRAVFRGGSWNFDGFWLRSATRDGGPRGTRRSTDGFRVARSVTL